MGEGASYMCCVGYMSYMGCTGAVLLSRVSHYTQHHTGSNKKDRRGYKNDTRSVPDALGVWRPCALTPEHR